MPNPQDQNQQNDQNQQKPEQAADVDKAEQQKKREEKKSAKKAAAMWKHINESVAEDERAEMKYEVGQAPEPEVEVKAEEEPVVVNSEEEPIEGEIIEEVPVSPFDESPKPVEVVKNVSTDPVEEEPVPREETEVDEFREDFWEILDQAGLSKRRIVIFLIVLVLGIFLLWFFVLRDSSPQVPVIEGEDGPRVDFNGLLTSEIIGFEFAEGDFGGVQPIGDLSPGTGLDAVLLFGSEYESDEVRFVRYVARLRDLQNIYDVDVYQVLDLAIDRRAALEEHLSAMNSLILESEVILNEIIFVLGNLESSFENIAIQRDTFEVQFFSSTQALYGEQAYQELNSFLGAAKDATEVQAYFNAYEILRDMYINSLNILKPRYEDIYINQEVIIKGIRVFDVPDSDIEAIIRLSN